MLSAIFYQPQASSRPLAYVFAQYLVIGWLVSLGHKFLDSESQSSLNILPQNLHTNLVLGEALKPTFKNSLLLKICRENPQILPTAINLALQSWKLLPNFQDQHRYGRALLIIHTFCECSRDVAVEILWPSLQNCPTSPSFIALAFRNGLEYCSASGHINSSNDPSTSCENLMSFSPVTPEFTRLECVYQWGKSSMQGRLGSGQQAVQMVILPDNCHPFRMFVMTTSYKWTHKSQQMAFRQKCKFANNC